MVAPMPYSLEDNPGHPKAGSPTGAREGEKTEGPPDTMVLDQITIYTGSDATAPGIPAHDLDRVVSAI